MIGFLNVNLLNYVQVKSHHNLIVIKRCKKRSVCQEKDDSITFLISTKAMTSTTIKLLLVLDVK